VDGSLQKNEWTPDSFNETACGEDIGTKVLVAVDDHGRLAYYRNCDQGKSALEDGPTRTAINPNAIQTRAGVDAKICWSLRLSNGHKFRLLVVALYNSHPLATLLRVGTPSWYHSKTPAHPNEGFDGGTRR
jgi:hypothetical protein